MSSSGEVLVSVVVYDHPRTEGSFRAIPNKHTGRPVIVHAQNKDLRVWREAIKSSVDESRNGHERFEGAVELILDFSLEKPKMPARKRVDGRLMPYQARPIKRPDVDKLARAVQDALKAAGVYKDDSQVTHLSASKHYVGDGHPRALPTPGVFVVARVDDDAMTTTQTSGSPEATAAKPLRTAGLHSEATRKSTPSRLR